MIAVLDASVVVKWFLGDAQDEPHAAEAIGVLRGIDAGRVRMVQPPHFLAETAAALARVQPATDDEDLLLLQSIAWEVVEWPWTYSTAVEFSVRLRHHLFESRRRHRRRHHRGVVGRVPPRSRSGSAGVGPGARRGGGAAMSVERLMSGICPRG